MTAGKERRPRPATLHRSDRRAAAFLAGPHVGTFTTLRPDGAPHVTAIRFTWDPDAGLARVLTVASARKARNITGHTPGARVALCQVAGFRWLTLEGAATLSVDPERIAEGVRRYLDRYGSAPPAPPDRVVIDIEVDRLVGLNL
ncbi:pyridoxamine 5'-phosphate oxidase family protein [Micromonospora arida]|uniref:pyridoxamine 5'-phosphate oxidase family protein n=1 Tax=Micromonospora arida TaxID=2203715 RepID=UPI0033B27A49